MMQKPPLLWVEVGKTACVLAGQKTACSSTPPPQSTPPTARGSFAATTFHPKEILRRCALWLQVTRTAGMPRRGTCHRVTCLCIPLVVEWLATAPCATKVVLGENHDTELEVTGQAQHIVLFLNAICLAKSRMEVSTRLRGRRQCCYLAHRPRAGTPETALSPARSSRPPPCKALKKRLRLRLRQEREQRAGQRSREQEWRHIQRRCRRVAHLWVSPVVQALARSSRRCVDKTRLRRKSRAESPPPRMCVQHGHGLVLR
jgi:hypothetical protein